MTRPTKEQLEQARGVAELVRVHGTGATFGTAIRDAFGVLLAATAEPTEEEVKRLTQERDLARLGLEVDTQDIEALHQRVQRAEQERDDVRTLNERLRGEVDAFDGIVGDTLQERDTLRQRVERAEREVEFQRTRADDVERLAEGQVTTMQNLRTRIAELEASREQESDPAEHDALLRDADRWSSGMLALSTTGSIIKRLATIVRTMPRKAPSSAPGADVVDRLYEAFRDGKAAEDVSRPQANREGHCEWHARTERAGIRAVISAIAAMGEEAVPFEEELMNTLSHGWSTDDARGAVRAMRDALSPVLGALRTRVAELEVALAVAKPLPDGARVVVARMSEPRADDDPDGVAEAARLGRL